MKRTEHYVGEHQLRVIKIVNLSMKKSYFQLSAVILLSCLTGSPLRKRRNESSNGIVRLQWERKSTGNSLAYA